MTTETEGKTVILRSRYRNYRIRDIQFENNIAKVTEAQANELATSPDFGQGRDFWRDVTPAEVAVPPAPNDPPADAPTREQLDGMTKDQLFQLAADRGIECDPKLKKSELVDRIAAALTDTD